MAPASRVIPIVIVLAGALVLYACSAGGASTPPAASATAVVAQAGATTPTAPVPSPTAISGKDPISGSVPATSTPDPQPTIAVASPTQPVASATPLPPTQPSASATPSAPTPTPPAPTPSTSTSPISFKPAQLDQGESAVVYLNLPATAATLSFGGKQYQMLPDNGRWWAVVGVGAWSATGAAPLSVSYTPAGGGAQTTVSSSLNIVAHTYPSENIDLDATTSQLLDPAIVNAEVALIDQITSSYTTPRLWSGAFISPAPGAEIGDIYGYARGYNGAPVSSYHEGTDFLVGTGTPVSAAATGRVVFAGALQVRGNAVIIDHGAGVFTDYDHFSQINVTTGQMVKAGDNLGLSGATGLVTGPHLHWEVIVRGISVDGQQWLHNDLGP